MKKVLITMLIGISSISLIGCVSNKESNENVTTNIEESSDKEESNLKELEENKLKEEEKKQAEEEKKKQEVEKQRKAKEEAEAKKKQEEEKKKKAEEEKIKQEEDKKKAEEKAKKSQEKVAVNEKTFTLYSVDTNTEKTITIGKIKSKSDSIKENLNLIANNLSKKNFDSLKIEVKSVKEKNKKLIATINLNDNGNGAWFQMFQGSLGGYTSETSLIESFLQRSYKGNWVDGVEFTYNGNKIEEFSHVEKLDRINYR